MKVIIQSENLKKCAERAMSIGVMKYFGSFSSVKLTADRANKRLVFRTVGVFDDSKYHNTKGCFTYASVWCYCHVIDDGSCYIDNDLFKRILAMNGDIKLESDEKTLKASTEKKKAEIPCKRIDEKDETIAPEIGGDVIASVSKEYLLDSFKNLSRMIEEKGNYSMCCYNVKERRGMMNITSLCGAAALINQTGFRIQDGTEFNIPSFVYNDLKTISKGNKKNAAEDLSIRLNDDYVRITGCDFDYIAPVDKREFLNVDRLMPSTFDYTFNAKAEDLCRIATEYAKLPPKHPSGLNEKIYPICFINYNGRVLCGTRREDYITADVLDTENFTGFFDFAHSFDAKRIKDILSVFGDVDILVQSGHGGSIGGWLISESPDSRNTNKESEYVSYILPVRGHEDDLTAFTSFMNT